MDRTSRKLRTPPAAAIAGVVFAVLLATSLALLRRAIPSDLALADEWIATKRGQVVLALNLVPFAGIAFLWFMGALRAKLGDLEDRFFATVFLGSGFLFLAMLFASASLLGAIVLTFAVPAEVVGAVATFDLARASSYTIMNIYAVKTAGVFMISTSTIVLVTAIAARATAYTGYTLAVFLLVGSGVSAWTFMVFPAWIFVLSINILWDSVAVARKPSDGTSKPGSSHP